LSGFFIIQNQEAAMDIFYKSFTGLELKKDKPGLFTAKFATLNVIDKDGDVILSGAIPAGKQVLISAYMHGSWDTRLPVGKGVIRIENDDALVDGEFNLASESGREHYETVKFAPELQEWSFGFRVKALDEESDWNQNPKVWRVMKELEIFEVSPVLRGAGVDTRVLSIKSDNPTSYSDQAETVLAAVNDLVVRSKSLADLRRKDHRELSAVNRERLNTLQKSLDDLNRNIETLLESEKPTDTSKSELLRLLKTQSELLEVI
jgi:HK97 family phage prohead protease